MAKPSNYASRSDVESFAACLMAARFGGFDGSREQGASDAIFGRAYGERRTSRLDPGLYRLGYHFGRFLLFAGIPQWREPANPSSAAVWFARFNQSPEGKAWSRINGAT